MAKVKWNITINNKQFLVVLNHGYLSGRSSVSVNDISVANQPVFRIGKDLGTVLSFIIEEHSCFVSIIAKSGLRYDYDLFVDDISISTGEASNVATEFAKIQAVKERLGFHGDRLSSDEKDIGSMKLILNQKTDSAYIYLTTFKRREVTLTQNNNSHDVNDIINLDFNDEGKLVGIKILEASKMLPKKLFIVKAMSKWFLRLGILGILIISLVNILFPDLWWSVSSFERVIFLYIVGFPAIVYIYAFVRSKEKKKLIDECLPEAVTWAMFFSITMVIIQGLILSE